MWSFMLAALAVQADIDLGKQGSTVPVVEGGDFRSQVQHIGRLGSPRLAALEKGND